MNRSCLGMVVAVAVAVAIGCGCGSRLLVGAADPRQDGAHVDSLDATLDVTLRIDAQNVSDSDSGGCVALNQPNSGLVCFGADPTPYQQYLAHQDGAPSVGRCPTAADFFHGCAEGVICYFGCGPLSPSEIATAHAAGVPTTTDAGGEDCCFWVVGRSGL